MPLAHRIFFLTGKGWNFGLTRNLFAAAVAAELPMMKWAPDRFTHDFTAAEIRSEV